MECWGLRIAQIEHRLRSIMSDERVEENYKVFGLVSYSLIAPFWDTRVPLSSSCEGILESCNTT